jgi:hypothetical protein
VQPTLIFAKVRLYQAYEQDENYTVTSINPATLQKAIDAANQVIGNYSLESDFGNNFMPGEYMKMDQSLYSLYNILKMMALFTED